jgi:hypothetical protein
MGDEMTRPAPDVAGKGQHQHIAGYSDKRQTPAPLPACLFMGIRALALSHHVT